MYKPWIPHFGNHTPYTTAQEDKIAQLEKELAEAKKDMEDIEQY